MESTYIEERHYRIGIERHHWNRERHILYRIELPPLLYYRIIVERLENDQNGRHICQKLPNSIQIRLIFTTLNFI